MASVPISLTVARVAHLCAGPAGDRHGNDAVSYFQGSGSLALIRSLASHLLAHHLLACLSFHPFMMVAPVLFAEKIVWIQLCILRRRKTHGVLTPSSRARA